MAHPIKRYLGDAALEAEDLRELRPLRVGSRSDAERYTLPLIRELRGTPFELCPDEVLFARSLMDGPLQQGLRKHNLALFRADQRRSAATSSASTSRGRRRSRGSCCCRAGMCSSWT